MWDNKSKASFTELKIRLTITLILTLPSGMEGFEIYSNASSKGLACMLIQHGKAGGVCILAVEGI